MTSRSVESLANRSLRGWCFPAVPLLVALLFFVPSARSAPSLSFEDRVKVQGAIERVYWSHQVGETSPSRRL